MVFKGPTYCVCDDPDCSYDHPYRKIADMPDLSDEAMSVSETILDEATKLTSGPRQEDYGHPLHDHTRTAKMWSALLGIEVSAEQVCLCMTALKMSRQINKPKRDNLVDGCGYLRNIEMIQEETGKMNENERTEEVP